MRPISRADVKAGPSDPVVVCGNAIAHPGAGEGPKGSGVHRLKRYASWV